MTRHRLKSIACCVVGVAALAACGGGDDESSPSEDTSSEETTVDDSDDAKPPQETDALDETEAPVEVEAPDATAVAVDILTDFGDVCRGVTLPGATAYDPARAGVHPLITMAGEDPSYETSLAVLPDQWDPVTGEEQTVELVACMNRTSSALVQTCDGYLDDDGNDTGNVVEMHDTTYDIRVIAATTGEVVATTQLEATDEECPSFVFFEADEPVKPWYAEPTDSLTAFLAPYVET